MSRAPVASGRHVEPGGFGPRMRDAVWDALAGASLVEPGNVRGAGTPVPSRMVDIAREKEPRRAPGTPRRGLGAEEQGLGATWVLSASSLYLRLGFWVFLR